MKKLLLALFLLLSTSTFSQVLYHTYKTELIDSSASWVKRYENNAKIGIVVTSNLIHIRAEGESYYVLNPESKTSGVNKVSWETMESVSKLPCTVEMIYDDPEIIITIKFQVNRIQLKYYIRKD